MRVWDKEQEKSYEKIKFIKRALRKQGSAYLKELPFSESIFKIHLCHKEFVSNCSEYIRDIELGDEEGDNALLDAADSFNTRCVLMIWGKIFETNEFANRIVKEFSLLVQFIINCRELEKSAKDFAKNVEDKLIKSGDDMKTQMRLKKIRSQVQGLGSELKSKAEVFIGEQINRKIDGFFLDTGFDWCMYDASGMASTYGRVEYA